MHWIDLGILIFVLGSGLVGVLQGLTREVLSLMVWLTAVGIALSFLDEMAYSLTALIPFADLRTGAALISLFLITFLVGLWITYLILNSIGHTSLTVPERLLGLFLGTLRGLIIPLFLMMLAGLTHIPSSEWWQNSLFIQNCKPVVLILRNMLPNEVAQQFDFEPAT